MGLATVIISPPGIWRVPSGLVLGQDGRLATLFHEVAVRLVWPDAAQVWLVGNFFRLVTTRLGQNSFVFSSLHRATPPKVPTSALVIGDPRLGEM